MKMGMRVREEWFFKIDICGETERYSPPLQGGVAATSKKSAKRPLKERTGRFYERGVKRKCSPAGRPLQRIRIMAASPASVARVLIIVRQPLHTFVHCINSVRKLKSGAVDVADHSSI